MLWASQVAPGNENGLKLRVYGTKGGLEWGQEDPNYLWFTPFGEPKRLITRGGAGAGPEAGRVTRVPAGHPEGYLEGFATSTPRSRGPSAQRRDGGKAGPGGDLPDDRGRPRRHGVHRGGGRLEQEGRGLGQALSERPDSLRIRPAAPTRPVAA